MQSDYIKAACKIATGEVIIFMDDDDMLTKRYPEEYFLYCFNPRSMDENMFISMAPAIAMPDILIKVIKYGFFPY